MSQAVLTPSGVVTATTTVSAELWTVFDLEQMPPGRRYELLDGVLYMVAMPAWPHPAIVDNLHAILRDWVHQHGLGRVFTAQSGLYLNELNYLDPDIVFLRPDQVPSRRGQRIRAATLAIEVLSPSNFRAPREERELRFGQLGVEELWYVSYQTRTLEIRRLLGSTYETSSLHQGDDVFAPPLFPSLEIRLAEVWEREAE